MTSIVDAARSAVRLSGLVQERPRFVARQAARRPVVAPSDAVSLAFWVNWPVHPAAGFTKTYAEPSLSAVAGVSSNGAPTTMVLPSTATAPPKLSLTAASEADSRADSLMVPVQMPPGAVNT